MQTTKRYLNLQEFPYLVGSMGDVSILSPFRPKEGGISLQDNVSVGAYVLYLEYLVGGLKKELGLEDIMCDRQWSREGWGECVDLVAPRLNFSLNGF